MQHLQPLCDLQNTVRPVDQSGAGYILAFREELHPGMEHERATPGASKSQVEGCQNILPSTMKVYRKPATVRGHEMFE